MFEKSRGPSRSSELDQTIVLRSRASLALGIKTGMSELNPSKFLETICCNVNVLGILVV